MADWPLKPAEIDYLFLTHAHIDHIGRLPELIQNGFAGEIICTHPTKALLLPMLIDAMGFSRLSKTRINELSQTIDDLSWGFEYGHHFKLKKGVSFKLGRAGHIMGSAFVEFSFPVHNGAPYTITFSGDLGCRDTPILPDPDVPDPCDLLIMESTYGNRNHRGREERLQTLGKKLVKALADKGKVFIPAFSLGRTQEILYELDRLFTEPHWQKQFPQLTSSSSGKPLVPVFVDSPLGLKITKIYSELQPFWDGESKELLANGDHPFDFERLYSISHYKDHKSLLSIVDPAIIIAGSGMCTGGRIVDHLEAALEQPENDIFFIGYQVRGTPGYDIIKYGGRTGGYVWLNNEKVSVRANTEQLSGYSAHADQNGLLAWVNSMAEKPGKIKLVHGDDAARQVLGAELERQGYCVAATC
jgi:metallo-beta-lactamase family protein